MFSLFFKFHCDDPRTEAACFVQWGTEVGSKPGFGFVFILLDSETPSISTDTALDHSHLAIAVKTCMKLNHT